MSGNVMTVDENRSGRASGQDVYVIDDDGDVRQSLHFLLGASLIRVWPFTAARDFLDMLPTLKPAPILLDFRMPRMDGLQLLHELRRREITWPVIMMTAHGDIATAVCSIKLGAIEFLEKPFKSELLNSALASAFELLSSLESEDASRLSARLLLASLSAREHDVIAILLEGAPNKVAAHRLNLSVRTVEMHRKNAHTKLGVRSVAEVAALVAAAGQPYPPPT